MPSPEQFALQQALARLRAALARVVGTAWDQLPGYDQADVGPFVDTIAPIVVGAQTRAASLTAAMLARQLGTGPIPVAINQLTGAALRAGVSPREVYGRPFITTWSALGRGDQWKDAVAAGRARLLGTANIDVQLAMRATARDAMNADSRVVGYARSADGDACELCLLASTQRYHTEDLMPIHNNCGCTVEPITGDEETGQVIEPELLDRLNVGDLDAARQLAAERVAIRDHGELGPVLTVAGQNFDDLS